MKFIVYIFAPPALVRIAQVFYEVKYTCLDRPNLFTQEYLEGFYFRSGVWVLVCAGTLVILILKLKTKAIVPVVLGLAVALWSLTFTITPEHRDWDEQWFGLYLVGFLTTALIVGTTALLYRKGKAQPVAPPYF